MVKITVSSGNIGLREFRENTGKYVAALKKGKRFTVFRHSKPVFAIVPHEEVEYDLNELDGPRWKTLIDFTKIKKGGIHIDDVIASLERVHGQNR